jgi:hypothetical protein
METNGEITVLYITGERKAGNKRELGRKESMRYKRATETGEQGRKASKREKGKTRIGKIC